MDLRPFVAYLVAAGCLATAYFVVDSHDGRLALWLALIWGTVGAVAVGIHRHRPAAPGPWRTVMVAVLCMALSDTVDMSWWGFVSQDARTVVADVGGLVGYVLLGVAAVRFCRAQSGGRDRGPVLDGVIVTIALTTGLWEAMLFRHGVDGVDSTVVTVLAVSFVASWVTAMSFRVMLAGGYRVFSGWALFAASWTVFCATAVFLWSYVDLRLRLEGAVDALWLAPLLGLGLSALHPRMAVLTEQHRDLESADTIVRTVLPALALLLPPTVVLVRWRVEGVTAPLAATASLVIGVVVIVRFAGLVLTQMQARADATRRADRDGGLALLGERGLSGAPTPEVLRLAEDLLAPELGPHTLHLRSGRAGPGQACSGHAGPYPAGPDRREPDHRAPGGIPLPGSRGLVVVTGADDLLDDEVPPFVHAVGHVLAAVVTQRDTEQVMRHRALHDALTGLANRELLEERLEAALGQERAPGRFLAVLFADLDGFKAVNDREGHAAGDQVLVTVAQRLAALVRPQDTLARFAGDEFVLVVTDVTDADLGGLCDRLMAAVEEPIALETGPVSVTASVGMTSVGPDDGRDADRLVCDADAAMFVAKQRGRQRAEVFDGAMRMASPVGLPPVG